MAKRDKGLQALPKTSVLENGVLFESEVPVCFRYIRNTESSLKFSPSAKAGRMFQQDIEPAGRYMLHDDAPSTPLVKGWERGEQCFNAPLVMLWNTGDGGYDEHSWKAVLSLWFSARGLRLTKKLIAAGYDGIITVKEARDFLYTSEIVSLAILPKASNPATVRRMMNPRSY